MRPSRRQHGFSLVEALVALLVLSIGLLGVAAMQLRSLQSAHAGYQRAAASLAAQDAVELLWSQLELKSGSCPALEPAAEQEWQARWSSLLPEVEISGVRPAPAPNCVYVITVRWAEGRFGAEAAPELTYTARLPVVPAGGG